MKKEWQLWKCWKIKRNDAFTIFSQQILCDRLLLELIQLDIYDLLWKYCEHNITQE